MEDSARLEREVARRAAIAQDRRAPIHEVVAQLGIKHGVNPQAFADPERADRLLAEAEVQARRDRLKRQADILLGRLPACYRNAVFPPTPFGDDAREWLEGFRAALARGESYRSLVFLGDAGTGKTYTAAAIARELLTVDYVPATFTTVKDMLGSLRPVQAGSGLEIDVQQYVLTPVLFLDDLGLERLTDWGAEQLYGIAHERSHNGRPTVTTSNLSGAEIRQQYDIRTVERLFGGAKLITVGGKTRRVLPF